MKTKLILLVAGIILITTCNNDIIDGFFEEDTEQESSNAELFKVSISPAIANGTLSANPQNAAAGTLIEITVAGGKEYMLKTGSLHIQYVAPNDHEDVNIVLYDKPYTFTMSASDATVSAEFTPYHSPFYMEKAEDGIAVYSMRQILDENVKNNFEFPYGPNDGPTELNDDPAKMNYSYWLGDTEVSFELWDDVRKWAVGRSIDKYDLPNLGSRGNNAQIVDRTHPVTKISWYDVVVWCNALTEWYEETYGETLEPVYQSNGSVLRDATDTAALSVVTPQADATGFRLPTSKEWELAARWRKDAVNSVSGFDNPEPYTDYFTKGEYASGVNSAKGADIGEVAVYGGVGVLTSPVKSKRANALGIYDMSGNVYEMCFDKDEGFYVLKGQSWAEPSLNISSSGPLLSLTMADETLGFRIARTD